MPQVWRGVILALGPPEGGICLTLQFLLNARLLFVLCIGLNHGEFTLQGHMGERQPASKELGKSESMLARQYSQVCEHRAQVPGPRAGPRTQAREHKHRAGQG